MCFEQHRGTVLYLCLEDVFCKSCVVLITWAEPFAQHEPET
jgi:hypothetical protein